MATTLYRNYDIVLADAARVAQLTAEFPSGISIPPTEAAATYAPDFVFGSGSLALPRIDLYGFVSGSSILSTSALSATWASGFTVDGDGVQYPYHPFGGDVPGGTISWKGYFRNESSGDAFVTTEALQTRHWACGFEIPTLGEGGLGTGTAYTRDASRTVDGKGFGYRSHSNESRTFTLPASQVSSWERFYVRKRTLPTVAADFFWTVLGSVEAGKALAMSVDISGNILIYNCGNQVFPGTLMHTISASAAPLNTWTRIDLLITFANAINPAGNLVIYVNGVQSGSVVVSTVSGGGGGLATVQFHSTSAIGDPADTGATHGLEIDIDDWSNYSQPTLFTGVDWNNGSHIQVINPTGFGSTHSVNWVGDANVLSGNPVAGQLSTDFVVASAATSPMEVTTDYVTKQVGLSALTVGLYSFNGGDATGLLGWSLDGVSDTTAKVVSQQVWATRLYSAAGVTPPELTTLNLLYTKGSAGLEQVHVFQATAEYIGVWGSEDRAEVVFPPRIGVHNAPFWDSAWAASFVAPIAPTMLMSGTYTGNGTGQVINTTIPIHWWWSRPLTGTLAGNQWWSSLLAGHNTTNRIPTVNRFIRAERSLDNTQYQMRVSGASATCNQNGVVYQWVGFSDAGMRYLINGAAAHIDTNATKVNTLVDTGFTPIAAFLYPESLSAGTDASYYKGSGHGTLVASPLTTAEVASVASFAAGSITSKATNLNTNSPQFGYSAWRANDGASTGPVAITSYTGDGTGARTIAVTLGSRYPHFALVVPHNGVSYFRDPSNTGTTSQTITGTSNAATAIVGGGVNQLLVHSALNAGAVVYDVFVLAGDTTGAGSGGWSSNPATPIFTVETVMRTTDGPWAPTDTRGWWMSTNKFTGSASLVTTPQNPKHPRCWDKLAAFATGNAAMLGGSPGAGITYNNHLIYAGDDYILSTENPTIRVFDGQADRLLTKIPPVGATVAKAIVSMILVGTTAYVSTLDSGTSAADYAGRVFALDIISGDISQIGAGFASGEVPYTMVWHMGRLWVGTNKGNGTTGKIYYFRPGIDTAWTTDFTLSTQTAGGACSMASFRGTLYVGCDAAAGVFSRVVARDSLGAWTTSHTASGGTARLNNGHLSMLEFESKLYAGYWNPDTTSVATVKQFDGTTWTSVYIGATTALKPYIGMFVADGTLFVIGGGNALAAGLIGTLNGTAWDNLTAFLSGPTTETALPIFGKVGI